MSLLNDFVELSASRMLQRVDIKDSSFLYNVTPAEFYTITKELSDIATMNSTALVQLVVKDAKIHNDKFMVINCEGMQITFKET